jgi:hypothetical protein
MVGMISISNKAAERERREGVERASRIKTNAEREGVGNLFFLLVVIHLQVLHLVFNTIQDLVSIHGLGLTKRTRLVRLGTSFISLVSRGSARQQVQTRSFSRSRSITTTVASESTTTPGSIRSAVTKSTFRAVLTLTEATTAFGTFTFRKDDGAFTAPCTHTGAILTFRAVGAFFSYRTENESVDHFSIKTNSILTRISNINTDSTVLKRLNIYNT